MIKLDMKIIIFAGGTGTRMWPLSRKSLPKQFIKMFNGKCTLELAIERLQSFGYENIYISTLEEYVDLTKQTVPMLPEKNIIKEPALRNLAPAVGLAVTKIKKENYSGPVAILWADHLMKDVNNFIETLNKAKNFVEKNKNIIAFMGEAPRFANNNLGWIHTGEEIKEGVYKFIEWHYKPPVEKCKKMFESGEWLWNPGYFVMDIDHLFSLYEKYQPEMYKKLKQIGGENAQDIYPTLEKISFDNGIIENIPAEGAVVLKTNMGWSDPGTTYALKEALVGKGNDNMMEGLVESLNTKDCLIINKEDSKLAAAVGLEGMVVINLEDVLLVANKENILEISDLIESLKEKEEYQKYL